MNNSDVYCQGTAERTQDTSTTNRMGLIQEQIGRSIFILKDYVQRTDREPVIGLEYILEYRLQVGPGKIENKYFCEICELDCDLVSMLEHLRGLRHQKLYLAKLYPYVLNAPSSSKEDRRLFMRRIAVEIELEEGTKMYKTDPIVRMVPIMKAKAYKESKRKTRWDCEADKRKRMKKALTYLETFEIDNDCEATTVSRLTEKLTAELKFYSDKLKEEALFPAKVARAKDVAMLIMQNAARQQTGPQNSIQKNSMDKASQIFNKGPPENINLKKDAGMPSGPSQFYSSAPVNPNSVFLQRPQYNNQMPVAQTPGTRRQDEIAKFNAEPQTVQTAEDVTFFKKLKKMLSSLPQGTKENLQNNSKLHMLKYFLLDKTANIENTAENQLRWQVASLAEDIASTENISLNQQLTIRASKYSSTMAQFNQNILMQVDSVPNPMKNAQANQNSQINIASLLQANQRNGSLFCPKKQECIQMDNTSNLYPYMEQQSVHSGTSHSNGNFSCDRPMTQNCNSHVSQYNDTLQSMVYKSNKPASDLYADESSESGMYSREHDTFSYSNVYDDYTVKEAPYTRRCLSPSDQSSEKQRFQDNSYTSSLRREACYGVRNLESFNDPECPKRESEGKHSTDKSSFCHINEANLSADLLKRIRGKDLFTVSAILCEHAESNSK